VLLRALPFALHAGERLSRRAPFGLRLALLGAARNPAQAAAATTFLAVALGAALFGLNYRATLDRQTGMPPVSPPARAGVSWSAAPRRASTPPTRRR
jgi:hypothetical protein